MQIEINERDSKYIWDTMGLKSATPLRANDECWQGDSQQVYDLRQFGEVVIRCVYDVLDSNAEMDTNEFADWDNPTAMYVETDMDPEDVK